MIVISDTSPLSALAEIGELELLPRLYGQVIIPEAVRREASHPHAPRSLAIGLANASNWLLVVPDPVPLLPETLGLDPGEAAAISLAWAARTKVMLIVDDKEGRNLCDALGLAKTGPADVLLAAARVGLVDFETVMRRLQSITFRFHPAVVEEIGREVAIVKEMTALRRLLCSWCESGEWRGSNISAGILKRIIDLKIFQIKLWAY